MNDKNWTAEQIDSFSKTGVNLLVAAGAGSGKTAVLIERIIRHLTQGLSSEPLSADRLLVITFTKAAAAEMKQRLASALQRELTARPNDRHLQLQMALLPQAAISNVHSFCLDLIRQHYYLLGLSADFRVAGELEQALLEQDVLERFIEAEYEKEDPLLPALADAYGGSRDDRGLLRLLHQVYLFSRSQPQPDKWLFEAGESFCQGHTIDDYPWSAFLSCEIRREVGFALQSLYSAYKLAHNDEDFASWSRQIQREIETIRALKPDPKLSLWPRQLRMVEFSRLPAANRDADPVLKERISKERDGAKKRFKDLLSQFCRRLPETYARDLAGLAPLMSRFCQLVKDYSTALEKEKRKRNILDFSDIEHFCLQLLEDKKNGVAAALSERFHEVLVDEYQDINGVQEKIIRFLSRGNNCFMVGDVKQSIYRFRLAEPQLFMEKFTIYGRGEGGSRVDLLKNFRSCRQIIDGINFIFRQLMSKEAGEIDYNEEAALIAGREEEGEAIEVNLIDLSRRESAENESAEEEEEEISALQAEARLIAQRIKELEKQGYSACDMAILLRASRNREQIVAEELALQNIETLTGTDQGGSWEAPEIAQIVALLQIIDNPYQDIPLAAALRSPFGGFDLDELASLRPVNKESLYLALKEIAPAKKKARRFLEQLQKWRDLAGKEKISLLIWHIYQKNGFFPLVGALPQGQARQSKLLAFYDLAREYEDTSYRGLFRFLAYVEELRERGDFAGRFNLPLQGQAVSIISVHRSKGLEFPVVFLAGLGHPFRLSELRSDLLWDKDFGLGPQIVDRDKRYKYPSLAHEALARKLHREAIAEEMRIFYVACTRARDKLILSGSDRDLGRAAVRWAQTANRKKDSLPSGAILSDSRALDWLGRALISHPDAKALRKLAEADPALPLRKDSSCWKLMIWNRQDIILDENSEAAIIVSREPEMVDPLAVRAALEYQYPYEKACGFAAKWAVSALNRKADPDEPLREMFPQIEEEALNLEPLGNESSIRKDNQPESQILDLKSGLPSSPKERGTLFHRVLQYLDLSDYAALSGKEGICQALDELSYNGIITQEEARQLDPEALAGFFASSLGQRISRARQLQREAVFTYAIPAAELTNDAAPEDKILLQGAIDLVFAEDEGWVIVDYKTGGRGESPENLREKYQQQLHLYCRAWGEIQSTAVKNAYLYMLDDGRIISVI
ncbi:MAG: helicase-exonuclease AddAB subunit AddA [Clostridiales bacterium]|nr:helicase-exonuclease AddAB subunit AddA [Clostridiales bacterium]